MNATSPGTLKLRHGHEWMTLHLPSGQIERHGESAVKPSDAWRVVGAWRCNNFGNVVEHLSLAQIAANPAAVQWLYKNGKQRFHIVDFDRGATRVWMNPTHEVR